MNKMVLIDFHFLLTLTLVTGAAFCARQDNDQPGYGLPDSELRQTDDIKVNPMMMNTNIALVGADLETLGVRRQDNVVIDPSVLLDKAGLLNDNTEQDIEEDEDDKFITTRSGKLRPRFETGNEDWSEDTKSRWY